ncbi:DUF397 domain-containing protein [Streptomyces sp. Ag109_O5-10]|uniref:DUF397 domain-containing protein n=1 Tax=Streptomyces sp. Ag109_O5-10 TaxID=1855349 RepID=UPI0008960730|nr:DUF397 domain-containing protein [Streptomyces sp. Ag109_O5-10]SEE95033.1 protein of unknown function [Streptomyces sp. Ag109_O5-10]
MRAVDLSGVTWRKSRYSNTSGGDCVEVSDDLPATASWRKSSYSNQDGGQCVEVSDGLLRTAADSHRSSYRNQDGGNFLEAAAGLPSLVPVRDSKAPSLGALLFAASAWAAFVDGVKR